MRQRIFIGNWKMHMTATEAKAFVEAFTSDVQAFDDSHKQSGFVGIAPPFTAIDALATLTQSMPLRIGAQTMSEYSHGAYTGEVSSKMLCDLGVDFVLLGHSERRQHFHEDNMSVSRKVRAAIDSNLMAVLCIGELLEDRKRGTTLDILHKQLDSALKDLSIEEMSRVVVAYEPIWAIGTGETASPELAQGTHCDIRSWISTHKSPECGASTSIIYGGSVNSDNVHQLCAQQDIDGVLVGGASLKIDVFRTIIAVKDGE